MPIILRARESILIWAMYWLSLTLDVRNSVRFRQGSVKSWEVGEAIEMGTVYSKTYYDSVYIWNRVLNSHYAKIYLDLYLWSVYWLPLKTRVNTSKATRKIFKIWAISSRFVKTAFEMSKGKISFRNSGNQNAYKVGNKSSLNFPPLKLLKLNQQKHMGDSGLTKSKDIQCLYYSERAVVSPRSNGSVQY